MKIKHANGLFEDGDVKYYLDISFSPLRVLSIFPDATERNTDITYLWEHDELWIRENIDDGTWVEFE